MITVADKIRLLAGQGVPQAEIAQRLEVSIQRVSSAIKHGKARGRPKSEHVCPLCGAPPSAQRRLAEGAS